MKKSAIITGLTGQDGSYLAELLLENGYEVHGIVRRTSTLSTSRVAHLLDKLTVHDADLLDQSSLDRIISELKPSEFYNLAAQSFVATSFAQPVYTGEVTGLGVTRCLEAIRHYSPETRFYQASSSEMFGQVRSSPQDEHTPFNPRSPYGVAKAYGHYMTINYRQSYNLFACSGICFNHESPRRGLEFVTRKITNAVANIKLGRQKQLKLGNLHARRDWGHAADFVRGMWLMLQQDTPRDYVLATGATHTVEEFVEQAFKLVNLHWRDHVVVDEALMRPADVELLCGDFSKAARYLNWKPTVPLLELISTMVTSDLAALRKGP